MKTQIDYTGTFVPPAVGGVRMPFNIAGPGLLKINEDHIYVEGYKSSSGFQSVLALLIFFFCFGLVVFLNVKYNINQTVVIGVMLAIFFGFIGYKGKFKAKKPVSYEIPWTSVKTYSIRKNNVAILQIEKFKPKGDIYFAPENDCDELLSHLKGLGIMPKK